MRSLARRAPSFSFPIHDFFVVVVEMKMACRERGMGAIFLLSKSAVVRMVVVMVVGYDIFAPNGENLGV